MPKIYEYFGFIFYFFSREHEPIHVHVIHNDKESIFDIIINNGELSELNIRERKGFQPLSSREQATAKKFIEKYYSRIAEKWFQFFVLRKIVRCTKVKVKL